MVDICTPILLGLTAGSLVAYNINSIFIIKGVDDKKGQIKAWQKGYKIGAVTALVTTLLYLVLVVPKLIAGASQLTLYTFGLTLFKWPWTIIFMVPTNNQLLDPKLPEEKGPALINRWMWLHWVRSLTEVAAFVLSVYELAHPK